MLAEQVSSATLWGDPNSGAAGTYTYAAIHPLAATADEKAIQGQALDGASPRWLCIKAFGMISTSSQNEGSGTSVYPR